MVTVDLKCPNCRNERGFNLWCVAEYRVKPFAPHPNLTVHQHAKAQNWYETNPPITAYGVAICSGCSEAVLVKFDTGLENLKEISQSSGKPVQYTGRQITVLDYHPKPPEPVTHPAYPEKIRSEYVDVQKMLDIGISPANIVASCRRILEMALVELGAEGETLFKKIKNLQANGTLTNVLADWAHQIRLIGNEGAHVGDPSEKEAGEMVDFIKVFLEYGFVLPHRIAELRRAEEATPE